MSRGSSPSFPPFLLPGLFPVRIIYLLLPPSFSMLVCSAQFTDGRTSSSVQCSHCRAHLVVRNHRRRVGSRFFRSHSKWLPCLSILSHGELDSYLGKLASFISSPRPQLILVLPRLQTALGFTAKDLHGGNTHGVNISPSTIRTSNQTRSDSKAGYITPLPPRESLLPGLVIITLVSVGGARRPKPRR